MKNQIGRLKRERITIKKMVKMYCNSKHHTRKLICNDCQELLDYAILKIDRCIFETEKPACSECLVHCYAKEKRENIKTIMRFAGPRMMYYHPYLGIMHFIDKYRFKANNKKKTVDI